VPSFTPTTPSAVSTSAPHSTEAAVVNRTPTVSENTEIALSPCVTSAVKFMCDRPLTRMPAAWAAGRGDARLYDGGGVCSTLADDGQRRQPHKRERKGMVGGYVEVEDRVKGGEEWDEEGVMVMNRV
jgi:hypothetical protein